MVMSVGPEAAGIAFYVGLLVAIVGFAAAVLLARRLPRAARTSFWATGAMTVGFMAIVLVGLCGVRSPRIGG